MEPAAPGWGGVLLALAVGAAVGYRAARRGAWGASEEQEAELREAWEDGYGHGRRDESENAYLVAQGVFKRGLTEGFDRGLDDGFTRGYTRAVQEAEARGLLRPRREAHPTFPGHG